MNWQEVYNKLSDDLVIAFNKFSASLKLTKSFRATVTEKISDKKYKVLYNKGDYIVLSDFPLAVNDSVWICVPDGNWDSLFVQSYGGFQNRVITTDKVVNNLTTNVAGTVLDGRIGKNLNDKFEQLNSDLALKADKSDFPYKAIIISYYLSAFTAYGGSYYHDFSISNSGGGIPFLFSSISGANLSVNTSFTGVTATAFRAWASSNAAEAIINILVLIPK